MLARFPRPMPKVFTAVALLFIFSFATTHAGSSQRSHLLTNQSSPDLAPEVVTITATKTDTLVDDVNSNTLVDPGDTLEYSIELSNSGDENALNTLFTDITDDTEVTVVAGSLTATPIGVNDSYNVIGNTHITLLAAGGLLLNDIDPDGGALTASCAPCTTTQGSTVTLNTDGSFTYTPPAGFTGSDTFIYTVTDPDGLTDTGTVTFTITNRIWWVDSAAPGGGDGRSTSPFNTLSAAQTASGANDIVFIYNRGANYIGGFIMDNGERLCGHGSNLQTCSGITPPTGTTFPAVATNPTIINAAGAGITLAQNNTIYGITIGSTTGFGITGTNFGTLTGQNLTINTGSGALSLTTGTANVTFNAITSTGGVNNVNLGTVGGTLNLGSGALSGSSSHAFSVNGGTAPISYTGTIGNSTADAVNIQNKTGGTVTLSGAVTSTGTGISLSSNTGATINFTGGIALTTSNEAFTATGGGTISITGSNNSINATNATALNVANTTIGAGNLNFLSISSSGAARGITLNNTGTNGGLTITGTGTTDGSGGTISNISQRGIELITARNISLANMTLTNANTTNGAISDGTLGGNENTDEHGAIYLQSVVNVNLTNVDINGAAQHGINGNTVTNLDISNSLIQNTGNAVWESGIYIFHLFGLPSASADNLFNNITVQDTGQFNIFVQNGSPTNAAPGEMDRLTFSNSTFNDSGNSVPGDHITVANRNNANFHTVVTNTTFTAVIGQTSDSIQIDAGNTSRSDIDISGSSFSNGNIAINLSGSGTSLTTFEVENNPSVTNGAGNTVNIASNGSAALQGHITNNTISTVVANNAGSGIDIVVDQTGSAIVDINNNNITGQSNGIRAGARNAGTGTADITIRNNTVTTGSSFPFSGVYLFAGNGSGGESNNVCVNLSANTIDTTSPFGDPDYWLEQYTGNTFRLQGLTPPAGATEAQVESFIAGTDLDPSPTDPTVEAFGGTILNYIAGTCAPSPVSAPEADTSAADETGTLNEQPETTVARSSTNDTPATSIPDDEILIPPEAEESVPGTVVEESASETVGSETAVSPTATLPTGETVNRADSDSIATDKDQPDELSPETIEATTTVGPFTLPPGESTTITFQVMVNDPFPATNNPICNQATISGSNFANILTDDPDTGAPADPTCTTVEINADLAITKTDGAATEIPGTAVTYTIIASNSGPNPDPAAVVADTFPAAITGVTWTCLGAGGATCTAAGSGNINETVNLPVGGSVTFTASGTISPAATGTLVNTATVTPSAGITDPDPANNSATDTTTLTPEADLSLTKTDGPDPTLPGSTLFYTVTVTNNGPSPAQGVIVTDTLPAGVTLVTTSGCTEDPAGVPTCTLGDIPALNLAQFTIEVTVDIGTSGTITNTANVSSSTPDPNPGNNTASAGTTLLEIDFGDAPDPTYPTLLASDGARHLITGPFLGASVDGESDAQPNATATGDDSDGNDDEDGVTLPGALVAGSTATVDVVASAACTLSGWVDFNGNGDWADADEEIFPGGTALAAGNNSLTFPVPAGATLGTTFARFRCTTAGAVSFTGLAADGEVEDYQVEIVDNQFSIGDVTALEGNSGDTLFMFTVTRTTNSTAASVAYATSDGTAVAGLDYTAVPSTTINFTAGGALTQTAVVTVTGDLMLEPDETFTVTLSNPVSGGIADGQATGTIINDDAPPALNVAGVTNFETAGTFPFTVTLSAVSGLDASVSYSTSDGTAAAGSDYTSTSGSLTIPAGSATGVISVTVLDDALPESTETFTLTLSSPVSATIGTGTAVGTIIDDENPPNIISVTDVTAGEAAGLVTFTLSLDTVSGSDVLVDYASNDGTAAAGQDYTAVSGTLTIANGTLSNTVSVPILDDNLDEITETFTLDLSNALNAVILDAQGIGTILDDDQSPLAVGDTYTTTEDTVLTVPAPGLLANDSDGDGDGLTAVLTTPPTNGAVSLNADGSFTYTPTLNFSGSDSFTYQANDGANNSNTADVTITVLSTEDPGLIYLPIIFNNHVQLPDLVVEEINVLPGGEIEVVITNQGQAPVGDNFWVDLYIDPDPLPTAVNQIWTQLADEGLVWGVDDLAALIPGGTLVLSSQDADAQYSNYSGSLASGTVVAVQVDSADVETTFGGVLEEHEILGEPYNNILVVTVE
jgi:uncharacterized repeat protein (TIGR01451 family)